MVIKSIVWLIEVNVLTHARTLVLEVTETTVS